MGGKVPGDDEEYLSCIYPTLQGVSNAWNGDVIVAHFAFLLSVKNWIEWAYLRNMVISVLKTGLKIR